MKHLVTATTLAVALVISGGAVAFIKVSMNEPAKVERVERVPLPRPDPRKDRVYFNSSHVGDWTKTLS